MFRALRASALWQAGIFSGQEGDARGHVVGAVDCCESDLSVEGHGAGRLIEVK